MTSSLEFLSNNSNICIIAVLNSVVFSHLRFSNFWYVSNFGFYLGQFEYYETKFPVYILYLSRWSTFFRFKIYVLAHFCGLLIKCQFIS